MKIEDYPITVTPLQDGDGGYLASIPDLPGCIADGDTVEQAVTELRDAFEAWSAAEIEDKGSMPPPKSYSGQFVVRMPKSLHQRLAIRAQNEGVSLNQLSNTMLAEGLHKVK